MLNRGGKSRGGKGGKNAKGTDHAERRHERHSAKGKVRCPLGDVLDLSAGGMRVACDGKPPLQAGSAATVKLRTNDGTESVSVRCCWVRKTGFIKGYQVGLKFIGITDQQADRLGKIAKYGFVPEGQDEQASTETDTQEEQTSAPVFAELELAPYFRVLELPTDASAEDIRAAYRRLVRTCHPDVNNAPDAQEQFVKLQEAYDILRKHANPPESKAA